MPTLSSPMALQIIITTICDAASDDKSWHIDYSHSSVYTIDIFKDSALTWHTVVLNIHVITESPAGVCVDVLLSDVKSTCWTSHAHCPHIWHVTSQLPQDAATVSIIVGTFGSPATTLYLEACSQHMQHGVSWALGTHHRRAKTTPTGIPSLWTMPIWKCSTISANQQSMAV